MAPYIVAIPARILGLSASTAMTLSGAFAAFFAALAVFWVIARITGNSYFAMAASLVVLCGGALAAGEGAITELLHADWEYSAYPYFPFLRRYLPAVPFPFIFGLFGSVWWMVNTEKFGRQLWLCLVAALCFCVMVFSYFYIWTTAAAWLGAIVILWLIFRPENWKTHFKSFCVLGVLCLAILGVYAVMLSHRAESMDGVQLLVLTHGLDLDRVPEYIGIFVIILLAIAGAVKTFVFKENFFRSPAAIFAFSFALVPIFVFNQQVITGHQLQPIHYQVFIGNYVAAFALMIAIGVLLKDAFANVRRLAVAISLPLAVLAIGWGFVEAHYTVRVSDEPNLLRDDAMPVARRLTELAPTDTPSPGSNRAIVFATDMQQADDLPTVAPQAVLWARHQHVFAGVSWEENKERYYQNLYYSGLDEKWLDYQLKNGNFVAMIALFGWGRHTSRLSSAATPLTYIEVQQEVLNYKKFRDEFDYEKATHPTLSYVVAPVDEDVNFTYLDRWYYHEDAEIHGKYKLYKLEVKAEQECSCAIE
jgi:hypothetical protein